MLMRSPFNAQGNRMSFTQRSIRFIFSLSACMLIYNQAALAQGTWKPVDVTAPDINAGVMILLSDGSVLCKGKGGFDNTGNFWNKLTPDINGSYVHGIWNSAMPMNDSRLYFSSQLLKDGRVYIAGGEYGTGKATCEIYDPITDSWSLGPATLQHSDSFFDANSEMLPDGKVLQAIVTGGSLRNYIYDPGTNTYTLADNSRKNHDESSWVKLPDNSILYVDMQDSTSERYIPSLGRWINDDTLDCLLYDPFGAELGGSFLLPDGRVFCIGGTGKTAYYTPSGDTTNGTWANGPDIPIELGAPDAAATMMVNGKILCAFSPIPTAATEFKTPTFFYVFDYQTDSFTQIHAPGGGDTLKGACYLTNMLNLPDGSILFSQQGSSKYYVYKPDGAPLAAGKPTIDSVIQIDCFTYMITGKLFNGISEGTCYGDDWQNNTNFPIVRLINNDDSSVHYARTYNWNSVGVMRGTQADTATFSIDPAMEEGTYTLLLVANGNPSANYTFRTCNAPNAVTNEAPVEPKGIVAYPNPAENNINLAFDSPNGGWYDVRLVDIMGHTVKIESGRANMGGNIHTLQLNGFAKGIYTVIITSENEALKTKIMVK